MNEERRKCDNKVAVVRIRPSFQLYYFLISIRFAFASIAHSAAARRGGGAEIARPRSIGPAWSNERGER